jgi:hypothetical protein
MLAGFGVGCSWGAALLRWNGLNRAVDSPGSLDATQDA